MFLIKRRNNIIGLDIGNYAVKLVSICRDKDSIDLKRVEYHKLNKNIFLENLIKEKDYLQKVLDELLKKINTNRSIISCSVKHDSCIVRNIILPSMEKEKIKETLKWEFAEYIPFSCENAVIDYIIQDETSEKLYVTAVIAPKNIIQSYNTTLKNYNINTINIESAALLNVLTHIGFENNTIIIDIGTHSSKIVSGNQKKIFFMRNLKMGTERLTKNKAGVLKKDKFIEEIYEEIRRAISFYNKNNFGEPLKKIFLTGGGAYINSLVKILNKKNKVNFDILKPFSKFDITKNVIKNSYSDSCKFQTEYSVAFGLCLSEVYNSEI